MYSKDRFRSKILKKLNIISCNRRDSNEISDNGINVMGKWGKKLLFQRLNFKRYNKKYELVLIRTVKKIFHLLAGISTYFEEFSDTTMYRTIYQKHTMPK